MSRHDKLLAKVLSGTADHNFAFDDLCYLLEKLGAVMRRGKGSHTLFLLGGIMINLQRQGGKAKAYQVAQVRALLQKRLNT